MSSQRGNSSRTRPQKYKNKTAFKNDLHDTSQRTKIINTIQAKDVCQHCKGIIDWKIKYKKYKPLTQLKKCVRCEQKAIKQAYHVMCSQCSARYKVCAKCCKPKEIVPVIPNEKEQQKLDNELQKLIQTLPERKRRSFMRYIDRKKTQENQVEETKDELIAKINSLKINESDSDFNFSDDSEDEFEIN